MPSFHPIALRLMTLSARATIFPIASSIESPPPRLGPPSWAIAGEGAHTITPRRMDIKQALGLIRVLLARRFAFRSERSVPIVTPGHDFPKEFGGGDVLSPFQCQMSVGCCAM